MPHALRVQGLKPVKLFVDEEHVRAWPGGVGHVKVRTQCKESSSNAKTHKP